LVNIPVLANDTDIDGDTLGVTAVSDPPNGTAAINGTTVDYTPDAGYLGDDTFTYTVSDGKGGTDTGSVTVTITEVPPYVVVDGYVYSDTNDDVASTTVDITTGTGANRLMLVGISWNCGTADRTISSVTFTPTGGSAVALTPVITQQAGTQLRYSAIYRWPQGTPIPSGQNGAIEVTFSGSVSNGIVIGVANFSGVNQATPLGTPGGAGSTSQGTAPTVTLSGLGGTELVFDNLFMGGTDDTQTVTADAGQTERWDTFIGNCRGAASTEQATGSSVTMSWTASESAYWAIAAVPINPAGGGGNQAPVAGTVNITPDPVYAGTQTFTATPSGFTDPDGDTLTYHYAWTLNGSAVGADSATLASQAVVKGNVIAVTCYASDGELNSGNATDSVTVGNTAPVAGTVNITPDPVYAGTQTFTATPSGFTDVDGDTLTYHYAWTLNGSAVGTDSATLASQAVVKGNVIAVTVFAYDGGLSSPDATDSVTVGNTAPTAGTVTITPDPVQAGTHTFTATPSGFADVDGDTLTYHYAWTLNGSAVGTDSATLPSQAVVKNDVVAVSVYVSDGTADSGTTADTLTVGALTYTLSYTANAGGTIVGTTPQTVEAGADGTEVVATPNTGYHFVSWSDGYPTAARTDLDVTGNVSVSATFAINTYTLTYIAGTGGSIAGLNPQTVNHGADGAPVEAVPASGYHFLSWSDGVLTAGRTDTNVTANKTVTANFQPNVFDIVYTSIRGTHRYHTAQLISQAMFPGPLAAGGGAVVAPGETFQEALCGAPLAAAYGGPVLLTPKVGLENGTKAELIRLQPDYVFVIGLSADIATAIQTAVPGVTVVRINGTLDNVYDMSRKVANEIEKKVGDMTGATGIITIGTNFPDAIAVSPLACSKLWPVILSDKADGSALHASALGALTDLGITKAIKVGTYAALPGTVNGLANLSGNDRYHTNAKVAAWAVANAGLTFSHVGFCTGDKFPDALAAGPYLAKDDGTLLLSPLLGPVPTYISTVLSAHANEVQKVTFIACVEPVIGQVKALLD